MYYDDVAEEIDDLTGKSAGHLCFGDFDFNSDDHRKVVEAAMVMWENLKSGWTLVTLWPDGRTGWLSPDGCSRATVDPDGYIQVERQ